jgi:hypothetical protein
VARRPDRHRQPRGDSSVVYTMPEIAGVASPKNRHARKARSRSASSRCSPTAAPRPTTSPTAS